MSKPSPVSIIRYLQACFSWDYSKQGQLNLLSKQLKARCFLPLETLATGLHDALLLDDSQRRKIQKALANYPRSGVVMIGLFPLSLKDQSGLPKQHLCGPLFLATLERSMLTSVGDTSEPDLRHGAARLLVNHALLSRVLLEPQLQQTVDALQAWIDARPLAKGDLASLMTIVDTAFPGMTGHHFETFPLLVREPNLAGHNRSTQSSGVASLSCSAAVYVTRRSRQSMGVLHELGQLQQRSQLSAPVRKLFQLDNRMREVTGPLNVLGALSTPQRKAAIAARKHALSVVHGPPGTGKTHVLAMIAADQLAAGQSVLICARNDAAVNVIQQFLAAKLRLDGAIVRGGRTQQQRELKARLGSLVQQGFLDFGQPQPAVAAICRAEISPERWPISKGLRQVNHRLRRQDRRLSSLARAINQTIADNEGTAGRWLQLRRWMRRQIGLKDPLLYLDSLMTRWRSEHAQRAQSVIDKLQLTIQAGVQSAVNKQRRTLAKLARSMTALERNQGNLQDSIDYPVIISALPIWITSLTELSQLLPLKAELFDLVIIDEASQADMASALPALQRARRAVVVGDTKQLRHVSFLPRAVEVDLASRQNLRPGQAPSFRDSSTLDWVNQSLDHGAASCFLDEHFRSAPEIIGFSNHAFYGNRLKLLTHGRRPSGVAALCLRPVDNGRRDRRGVNAEEATAIVQWLHDLQGSDQASLSVGIISPFRDQVDHLQKVLERDVSAEIRQQHRLLIGTAHELQGAERDVVLFSAVVDDASSAGSLAFLSRPEVLNVSITRARHRMVVFVSRSIEKFSTNTLFGQYLQWVQTVASDHSDTTSVPTRELERDRAITDLTNSLDTGGYKVQTHCLFGSVQIDILIRRDDKMLGIDLVGFGGPAALQGLRHHELELMYRVQLPIIPITRQDWTSAAKEVVDQLNLRIQQLNGNTENVDGR